MGLYTSIRACEARFYHLQQFLYKINHLQHGQQYCGTEPNKYKIQEQK